MTAAAAPRWWETLWWGTFGPGGAEHCGGGCQEHRLRLVRLADCGTDHLEAILRNCDGGRPGAAGARFSDVRGTHVEAAIRAILGERKR